MNRKATNHYQRHGLTRIEVLFLLGVVTLLGTLFIPYVSKLREQARAATCRDNLRSWTTAIHQYHETHRTLPPAAIWSTTETHSLTLHHSKRVEQISRMNWAILLLPYLQAGVGQLTFAYDAPIGSPRNIARTQHLQAMKCGSDHYNSNDNPYRITAASSTEPVAFARGNYAINGGTHNFSLSPPSTTRPQGDYIHLSMRVTDRTYQLWGNGIAGINKSFSLNDFENGHATLVALEEVRAGIHPADPRGVWSLGQIGGSITWGHGVNGDAAGPNNQWHRSDDILGCGQLHSTLGSETLLKEKMPCVSYVDTNQQATSRSLHPGGVHVALLDGSVKFLSDDIDRGLWHVLHSRETPKSVLEQNLTLSSSQFTRDEQQVRLRTQLSATAEPRIENSIGMQLVLIPAGQFRMGQPDRGRFADLPPQAPPHDVAISRSFYMSVTEVTNEQYLSVVPKSLKSLASNANSDARLQHPVTNITWQAANQFCERLNLRADEKLAGRRYRLPTEAEWEYACRSGESQPYLWHSKRSAEDRSGEAGGIEPALRLTAVGSYPANTFGLHDMRGNAWEWTNAGTTEIITSKAQRLIPKVPQKVPTKSCVEAIGDLLAKNASSTTQSCPPGKQIQSLDFAWSANFSNRK